MKKVVLFLLLLFSVCFLYALRVDLSLDDYVRTVYNVNNGLPQNSVQTVLQTSDGYVWLGTEEGLVLFNGDTFTVFGKQEIPQASSVDILTLHEDSTGRLWAGTYEGGVILKEGETFTVFGEESGLVSMQVNWITSSDGMLYVALKNGGVMRYEKGRFVAVPSLAKLSSSSVRHIRFDEDGTLWISTDKQGLFILDSDGSLHNESVKTILPVNSVRMTLGRRDDFWVALQNGGLIHVVSGKTRVYNHASGLPHNTVLTLLQDRDGGVWAGTYNGIAVFRENQMEIITPDDGLPAGKVRTLMLDREGTIWAGTLGGGMVLFTESFFRVYDMRDGLSNEIVSAVMEDSSGNLWVGTYDSGLNILESIAKTFAPVALEGHFLKSRVYTVAEKSGGGYAVGAFSGFFEGNADGFSAVRMNKKRKDYPVMSLCADGSGGWFVGTFGDGVYQMKDGAVLHHFSAENGLASNSVHIVKRLKDGRLFIGYASAGADIIKDTVVTHLQQHGRGIHTVFALHEDDDGILWLGSNSEGIGMVKDGEIFSLTKSDGLGSDGVFSILEDESGRFWMSSNRGIHTVEKEELKRRFSGGASLTHRFFGVAEGMKSGECNGSFQPAGWKRKDGSLIFPTLKGVVEIDPDKIRTNTIVPPVYIEDVIVNGLEVSPDESLTLAPDTFNLEFHYAALSYIAPERLEFRYKLEGFDKEWNSVGNRRTAWYTNLPPGNYIFKVQAANSDGVWNRDGATLNIIRMPAFYETWWFYPAILLLFSIVGAGFYQMRIKILKRRQQELEQLNASFSRFVPMEFLKLINREEISDVALGDSIKKRMSVLFSDIRNFTTLSETMLPEENYKFINSYLKIIEPIIRKNSGFIDKYVGDAVMALFPNNPNDAVNAAIEMQKAVDGFNSGLRSEGKQPIRIGIGIHIGDLLLGTVGNEYRMEGTVISDAVNIASRLESQTKTFATKLLISDELYRSLQNASQYATRYLGEIQVKGRKNMVGMHDIFCVDNAEITQLKLETKELFEEAISYLEEGDVVLAYANFRAILKINPNDMVCRYYLDN
ncbi:hypothetical protein KAH37_01930 [bacterium]|nr:hypothetical protein [bacterium]